MDDGERDRPPGDRDAGRRRTPPATHTPVDAVVQDVSGETQAVLGRLKIVRKPAAVTDESSLEPLSAELEALRDRFAISINGESDPNRRLDLWFDFGKEYFLFTDPNAAYEVFRHILMRYQDHMSHEQAFLGAWYLFEALHMMPVSIETNDHIVESIRFLVEVLELKFGKIFDAVIDTHEAAMAFRRGKDYRAANERIEGSLKTGHEEAIELGEDGLKKHSNLRVQAKLSKIVGASKLMMALPVHEKFLEMARSLKNKPLLALRADLDDDAQQEFDNHINWLKEGKKSTKDSIDILEANPDFATEDGELLRVHYNYARILTLLAITNPKEYIDAELAINKFRRVSIQNRNRVFVAWANILSGEIRRYAGKSGVEQNLDDALKENERALQTLTGERDDLQVVQKPRLSAWINMAAICIDLKRTDEAKKHFRECADYFFDKVTDLSIIDWVVPYLQKLARKLDMSFAIPKIAAMPRTLE